VLCSGQGCQRRLQQQILEPMNIDQLTWCSVECGHRNSLDWRIRFAAGYPADDSS
jgi:hypothetical protein